MKKYYFLAVACAALILSSCQKEDLNSTVTNGTNSADGSSQTASAELNLVPKKSVNYGALIGAPNSTGSMNFKLNVADNLGISCLRERTDVPSKNPEPLTKTKYKVLLNFSCGNYSTGPKPFISDLNKYQKDLTSTLAVYTTMPAVAVIENEESNRLYYSGTAQQYINQLNVAISVMHANGVKVANGGLTYIGLNYLVYEDLLSQGKEDSAAQFKLLTHTVPKSTSTQERGAFVDALLKAYATMDLDYVNFHWKGTSPDTRAFVQVINYLKKRTGKPIMSNELGQFDTDPNTLRGLVQKATDADFAYAVWYSPDERAGKKDTPLQHDNQSLTPSGVAYKSYPQN